MTSGALSSARPVSVDIAVLGGGIGGLAAAVALRQAGHDVHVFERTAVLKEVGGPLIVREPSLRLLEQWGIEGFHQHAVLLQFVDLLDIEGALIKTSPMDFHGQGESYSIHRADIHDLLRAKIPADRLHLGLGAVSVGNSDDSGRAVIDFTDGSRVEAGLVVGADGIHSVARTAIFVDDAVFQDAVVCRMFAPASALPEGMANDRARMWADGPRRLLTVPVRGGTLVAVDAIVDGELGDISGIVDDLRPENQWNAFIPFDTLRKRFSDFDPALLSLLDSRVGRVRVDLVYDRSIIDSWSAGRVVLVGDAAHPMAPRQGQGANQAIQDAGALAEGVALFGLDDPAPALAHYHQLRYATATGFQSASRATPEQLGGKQPV